MQNLPSIVRGEKTWATREVSTTVKLLNERRSRRNYDLSTRLIKGPVMEI